MRGNMGKTKSSARVVRIDSRSTAHCECCSKTLPWRVLGFGMKVKPTPYSPEQVQALLFTLYSCVRPNEYEAIDNDPTRNELTHVMCTRCSGGSDLFYVAPLHKDDGYFTKPYCITCATSIARSDATPMSLLCFDRNSHSLRMLLRTYRKAYLQKAANSVATPLPSGELLF